MANAAKLRDQARAAENRGQWAEAVSLYRQLLEGGDDADTALWNRVGDLHLRAGETDRAVDAYERAIGGYTESGYFNNAIALCRKVLRLVPGRTAVYLRLGQISAAAGFLPDSRQNFLEYAERMRRAGNLDASFAALKEFADLSPEDTDVRRLLADQLLSHGQRDEAIEQLRALIGAHLDAGNGAAAQRIREQILAIDPGAETTPLVRERSRADDDFLMVLDDGSEARPRAEPEALAPPPPGPADTGVPPLPGLEPTAWEDPEPLPGLEPTALAEPAAPEPAPEPIQPSRLDEAEVEEGDPLPILDFGDHAPPPEPPAAPESRPEPELVLDPPPLPEPDPPRAGDSAPEPEPEPASLPDPLAALRARVAEVPEDDGAREALVRALRERGHDDEVAEVLGAAHRALAARGRYLDAVSPITALIGLRPGDGLLLQKRVEYAFRSGNTEAQVAAYLDLGRHLVRSGREEKAVAVFQRVLELDPDHGEAREAAARATAAVAPPRPSGAPSRATSEDRSGGEYVDLASLVLAPGDAVPTTRFVVEEKEPSGDEDRDFAEMLAHFRQKVAEHIEVEDSSSHYDLGVAFLEMGLVDEAIAQFQVALRGGANPLATLELLGQCFVEKGQHAVGARVLDRALRLPGVADSDLVGVLYLLGRVKEALGEAAPALEFYERAVAVDIRFRDSARRIERLRAATGANGFDSPGPTG